MLMIMAKMKLGDKMIIMFVRHAEAKENKITALGKKQCELMCEQEEDYVFSRIYCSSVERCKETAKYFQKKFNLEMEILDKIKDREVLKTTPQNKAEKLWYDNYLNKEFSHSNPEGCKEFLERNFGEFEKIIRTHKTKNENVILVAHSCTFYALLEYLKPSKSKDLDYCRLSNCSKIYFEIN